jgi:gas vesicle protein
MSDNDRPDDLGVAGLAISVFVAGAVLGAVVALLTAPATGREARAYVRRQGKLAATRGRDTWQRTTRASRAMRSSWQRAGDDIRTSFKEAYRREPASSAAATVRTPLEASRTT